MLRLNQVCRLRSQCSLLLFNHFHQIHIKTRSVCQVLISSNIDLQPADAALRLKHWNLVNSNSVNLNPTGNSNKIRFPSTHFSITCCQLTHTTADLNHFLTMLLLLIKALHRFCICRLSFCSTVQLYRCWCCFRCCCCRLKRQL